MATTLSFTPVVAGAKVLAGNVNAPFTTLINFCNSIDGANIQDDSVPGSRLKANSITGAKLLDATLTAGKFAANSVITAAILNDNVTTAKLDDLAVTNAKIANGTIAAAKLAAGIARIDIDTYTGDGAATQAVTGIGFQPSLVLVFRLAAGHVILKTDDMTGADAKNMTAATTVTDCVISFDADGFTVGDAAHVNTNLTAYFYLALAST